MVSKMYKEMYSRWLAANLDDPDLKPELESIQNDDAAIQDRFAVALKFGTAGLRGVIGAGTNRMNVYVVRQATQGLANWVKTQGGTQTVAISYDSRIKSDVFAKAAAEVATEVVDAVKASADKPVAETAAEVVKTAKKATCKTSTKKAAEAAVTTAKKAAEAATAVAAVATDAVKEVAEKPAVKAAADEAVKAVKEVAEKPAVKAAVEAADKAVKEVAEKPAVKAAAKAADEAVKTVVEAAKPVVEAAKPAVNGKNSRKKHSRK